MFKVVGDVVEFEGRPVADMRDMEASFRFQMVKALENWEPPDDLVEENAELDRSLADVRAKLHNMTEQRDKLRDRVNSAVEVLNAEPRKDDNFIRATGDGQDASTD